MAIKIPSGSHALLWSGNAASVVDLHPAGFDLSYAYGISGDQQVGQGAGATTASQIHALLWSGTADSCVDLNPVGFDVSEAWGVSGGQQVGYGGGTATEYFTHALLWSGTAESFVDLHTYVPDGYMQSYAYGIDSAGNIVGCVSDGIKSYAVMWTPVIPAPTAFVLGAIGAGCVAGLRRRKIL